MSTSASPAVPRSTSVPVDPARQSRLAALNLMEDAIVARRRAEAALTELQERERQLGLLLSNLPGMAYRCKFNPPRWTMEFVSEGARALTGYDPKDLIGDAKLAYGSLVHPADQAAMLEGISAGIAARRPFLLSYRLRTASGTERWVWEQGQGVFDAQGGLVALEGFTADVTRQKRAEVVRETYHTLMAELSVCSTPLEAARAIFRAADRIWSWDAGSLNIIWPGQEFAETILCLDVVEGERREIPSAAHGLEKPTPRMRRTIEHGAELLLRTPEQMSVTDSVPFGDTGRISASLMTVPIRHHGQAVGIVTIQSYTRDAFTRTDLDVLQSLVDHCSGALERIHAERELRRDEARFRSLATLLQHRTQTVQEFLDFALHEAIALTRSRFGYIYHYHEDRRQFVINSWSKEAMKECAVLLPENCYDLDHTGLWGEAVRQRRPILVNDFQAAHPLKRGYPEGHVQLLKYLTLPVVRQERIVAVVGVANKESDYDQLDIEQVSLLMDAAWTVVEQMEAHQRLRVSEDRFRTLVETAPEAIFIQVEGAFAYVNTAAVRVFGGKRAEDLLHRPVLDFFPRERQAHLQDRFREVQEQKQVLPAQDEACLTLSGSPRDLNLVAVPFTYEGREGALVFARDITERRRLEDDRRALEAQMRQHQKLESIGTLAAGVAHEINNPVNGIMNYAQILLDTAAPGSSVPEMSREIIHEAERVATIVRNLLQFSRQESQAHSPARLCDMVEQTLSLIRTVMRHDQITLRVEVPERLPRIRCRSQQIQQVIMNLMTNARDALNERYPKFDEHKILSLRAHCFERAGGPWVRMTVEDFGSGIPDSVRERMFDPFFTTKPRDKGTGLGLSISHGIVQEHGGEISAESELGKFTRLHVDLPAMAEDVT